MDFVFVMIIPNLIDSKTQKSLTVMLTLPANHVYDRKCVRAHTKTKGKCKRVCVLKTRTKSNNTHNTSMTFHSTITATSCRTELALTYLPNLSSL